MTPYASTYTFNIPYQNAPWLQPAMPTFTPDFCGWGVGTPSVFGYGSSTSSSSGSSSSNMTREKANKTKEDEEKDKTGLGLTKKELKDVQKANQKQIEATTGGASMGEEVAGYTAFGAIGAVGISSPIAKSKTYLFGEHNKLFSGANDIYTATDAAGKKITYNNVFKANSTAMSEAKAAMRKAEMLMNKARWNKPLESGLYDRMSSEMKAVLKELALDPKNEQAQAKLKNLTKAINDTVDARKGYWKRGFNSFKNWTWRKWRGKPSVQLTQPTVQTFETNLANITNTATQTTGQAAGTTTGILAKSKGALKSLCKGFKSSWLIGAFEVWTDKDKLIAAWGKDTSSGLKQTGKTAFKAAGAMAGFALGAKAGALIGSFVPGAGTIVGGIIGGLAGFAIGGLCAWAGREAGKLAGNALLGSEEPGAKISSENITKAGTSEQLKQAIDTATWAQENMDKLTKEEQDSINVLHKNLIQAGVLSAPTSAQ